MVEIDGFPTISEYIELPNIMEMMKSPILLLVSAEDAYKHGGELVRHLLSKTPLKNDKKYVTVTSQMQYLTPEFSSVRSEVLPRGDWHIDSSGLVSDDTNFLLLNETDWNTEFNANPMSLPLDLNQGDFIRHINHNAMGFIPKRLEGNRMATFGCKHVHRAIKSDKPAFRFMWRVSESNHFPSQPISKETMGTSFVFKYKMRFPNIQQLDDKIIVHI